MMINYPKNLQKAVDSLLHKSAHSSTALRRATLRYAKQLMGQDTSARITPDVLAPYLQKVTRHAYRVSDEDVNYLVSEAHYSEDEVFELTLCAAVGASLAQYEQGLRALKGENSCD